MKEDYHARDERADLVWVYGGFLCIRYERSCSIVLYHNGELITEEVSSTPAFEKASEESLQVAFGTKIGQFYQTRRLAVFCNLL